MDMITSCKINRVQPGRHVAVYTFPFSSHPSLLLTLVNRLASAAPTVVFSFFNTKQSNQKLLSEVNHDNIRLYDVSDGIPKDYVFVGKPQEDINLFLQVAEDEFRNGLKVAENDFGLKISCLVVDAFFWFCADIADELNIPWVAFWTAGACSLSSHFYTDLIREKHAQFKGPDDEIFDLIPGLSAVRLSDLPGGIIYGNLKSPFSIMVHKMGQTLARATAVPLNSFQELDPDITKDLCSKFKNFLNIGPFNFISKQISRSITDEFSCIPWLETQKPSTVAYICFGTVFKPPPHELVALAEALEETKTPFLWSINNESTKHFPKGFLKRASDNGNGKVVPWAPQVLVLEHFATGVFITHGGWNSVLESIGAGVPMICRPFVGDQQINTCMVERVWGIGMKIEGGSFTKNGTCYALENGLLVDGLLKMWKKKIEVLKDVAHKAVEPNGSSDKNFKTLVDLVTS
ncbi:kaempferol 3-O-beta-D-galactosyltransferase-like [Rutidosis leptorrhynchoides]|uniref:kaempferol 3-O-beta-D-galactosyltransferase-like n=1 Tax=Rutidosis leptorrhynchoides TaxID=125765 RepID=UPI003A994F0B